MDVFVLFVNWASEFFRKVHKLKRQKAIIVS